ncbi:hypothetical protein [Natrinema sp. H-ect4]|uniref:hypothetical protein n=1 Tax=Natrinema sp. H-ect4 TaxID=3242699 RepID=UPI0035A86833
MDTETPDNERNDLLKKVYEIGHGLDLSEDALDKAVDLVEAYRDQFKVYEQYLPAAAVHVASRLNDEPRTQKMIVAYLEAQDNLFTADKDEDISRYVREDVKKLRKQEGIDLSLVRSTEYLDYIVRQLENVEASDDVVETAEKYCEAVEKYNGLSRSKVAIAGSCLKAAVEEIGREHSVTTAQLADVTGMNRKTFENNLKHFRENEILPQ